MAKQRRTLPARKRSDRSRDEESLLLRSAESLGRVIGALQRQLDSATKRLSSTANEGAKDIPSLPKGVHATRRGTRKRSATAKSAGATKANGAVKKTKQSVTPAARKKTRRR